VFGWFSSTPRTLQPDTRARPPMGRALVSGYIPSTRTPPTCPNRHVGGVSRFSTPPSSQTQKRVPKQDAFSCLATFLPPGSSPLPPARHEIAPHMGHDFVSAYIPSPPDFWHIFLVLYFFTIPPSPYSSVFLFYLAFFYHFRQFPLYNVTHLGIFLLCKLSYLNKYHF